jgi:ABC-type amino acid transport substrate-binding protein
VLVTKNGQALVTALLSGQATADVTHSTTLAFLVSRLDTIGRGLFGTDGHVASPEAAQGMLHAFQALAEATDKGLSNSGEGAEVVAEALKAQYAAEGKPITSALEKAFARAAKDIVEAFGEVSKELNKSLRTAKSAGGESVTTLVDLGGGTVTVTNGSSGSSGSSSGEGSQPQPQVEATGTFDLPEKVTTEIVPCACD